MARALDQWCWLGGEVVDPVEVMLMVQYADTEEVPRPDKDRSRARTQARLVVRWGERNAKRHAALAKRRREEESEAKAAATRLAEYRRQCKAKGLVWDRQLRAYVKRIPATTAPGTLPDPAWD